MNKQINDTKPKKKLTMAEILFYQKKQKNKNTYDNLTVESIGHNIAQNTSMDVITLIIVSASYQVTNKLMMYSYTQEEIPKELHAIVSEGINISRFFYEHEGEPIDMRVISINVSKANQELISRTFKLECEDKVCIFIQDHKEDRNRKFMQLGIKNWKLIQKKEYFKRNILVIGIQTKVETEKKITKITKEIAIENNVLFVQQNFKDISFTSLMANLSLLRYSLLGPDEQLQSMKNTLTAQINELKTKEYWLKYSAIAQLYQIWTTLIEEILQIIREILVILRSLQTEIQKFIDREQYKKKMEEIQKKIDEYKRIQEYITKIINNYQELSQKNTQQNLSNILTANKQIIAKFNRYIQLVKYLQTHQQKQYTALETKFLSITSLKIYQLFYTKLYDQVSLLQQKFNIIQEMKQKYQHNNNKKHTNQDKNQLNTNQSQEESEYKDHSISNQKIKSYNQIRFQEKFYTKIRLQAKSINDFMKIIRENKKEIAKSLENMKNNLNENVARKPQKKSQLNVLALLSQYFIEAKQKQLSSKTSSPSLQQIQPQYILNLKQLRALTQLNIQHITTIIQNYNSKRVQDIDFNEEYLRDKIEINQHNYKVLCENWVANADGKKEFVNQMNKKVRKQQSKLSKINKISV